jgi:hypothetical protein
MPQQPHTVAGREAIDPSIGEALYPVYRHVHHGKPYATSPAGSISAFGRFQSVPFAARKLPVGFRQRWSCSERLNVATWWSCHSALDDGW